ncbi:MAG: hypothetical protein ACRDK2_12555, partial [Solirubrobacteraceae bacterium]
PRHDARIACLLYLTPLAVLSATPSRISKITLLARAKTRRSTNPMRSRTSPNKAMKAFFANSTLSEVKLFTAWNEPNNKSNPKKPGARKIYGIYKHKTLYG